MNSMMDTFRSDGEPAVGLDAESGVPSLGSTGEVDPKHLRQRVLQSLGKTAVHEEQISGRPGVTEPWPAWLNEDVARAFQRGGVQQPWHHQVLAADAIHSGQSTVVATGTASGKSLAYWMPALTSVLERGSTVLYLTPTKALAQDQLKSLNRLEIPRFTASTYDGDTPPESRPWVRQNASYVLTNPEMIHRGILPNHTIWRHFLSRLAFVIVDEAHHYRGVFGSHMAAILRRLRRLAHHHGAEPVCVAASATMAHPEVATSRLFGVGVAAFTEDTSRRGEVSLLLVDPSDQSGGREPDSTSPGEASRREIPEGGIPETGILADESPPDETSFGLAAKALAATSLAGASSLGFIRARKGAEALAEAIRRKLPDELERMVTAYRGGLLPEERRLVESGLQTGRLRTVATTSALELGVDISGLDSVVICGWPGTRASFLQQIGRAGRRGNASLAVFIADDNPLDRYLVKHPEKILREPLESVTLDPANPHVLLPHLAAAVGELPFLDAPTEWFGETADELMDLLIARGWVRRRSNGLYWTSKDSPTGLADLRGAGRGPVSIAEAGSGRLLGTVDEASAPAHVHPGAVYRHQGATYLVESLDLDALVAVAKPAKPPYSTTAKGETDLRVLGTQTSNGLGAGHVSIGDVEVTNRVIGFIRRSSSGEFLGLTPLEMPETRLDTKAVWWTLTPEVLAAAQLSVEDLPGSVHAAEHAAIGILPGLATCDRWDLGGLSTALHPDTGLPTVFVYDGHPGGAGIAQHGFENVRAWLSATLEVIESCGCESGCPGCVQSPKCGNGNEPLNKPGAALVLRLLLG